MFQYITGKSQNREVIHSDHDIASITLVCLLCPVFLICLLQPLHLFLLNSVKRIWSMEMFWPVPLEVCDKCFIKNQGEKFLVSDANPFYLSVCFPKKFSPWSVTSTLSSPISASSSWTLLSNLPLRVWYWRTFLRHSPICSSEGFRFTKAWFTANFIW